MPYFRFILLCVIGLLLPVSQPAQSPHEVPLRAPFALEFPDLNSAPILSPDARIPDATQIRRLRFKVRQPFAAAINYGQIFTAINGEAANTICNKNAGTDGHVVNCNLERYPRFALRPGKNVLEITALDRSKKAYYASYVINAGGVRTEAGAAAEQFPVAQGPDQQPPEIRLTTPGRLIVTRPDASTVKIQGIVSDDQAGALRLTINGETVTLTPGKNGDSFNRSLGLAPGTPVVIEAQDKAGNRTRLTLPVEQPAPVLTGKFKGRKFALLVGVSKYQYAAPDLGFGNLRYADADAQLIRDFLRRPEGGNFAATDILYLTNEQATLPAVRDAMARFLRQAGPEDLVFIYLAGHGGPDPYAPQNLYYLLHDAKTSDLAGTALPMPDLKNFLDQNIRAQRVVVLVDTCNSAGLSGEKLTRGLGLTENNVVSLYAEKLFGNTGRTVITAADVAEFSYEGAQWGGGHGVFTWTLLEGLRGAADTNNDNLITSGELCAHVRSRVQTETNFKQNPRVLFDLSSDFVLAAVAK